MSETSDPQANPTESAGDTARMSWPPDLAGDRPLAPNQVIGNYRLQERIGWGGMGVVYRAEQLAPVQRTVAIKLVKLGIDTPDIVARFESERQALAVLEHPGIARVYDAGVTNTGRPYFVMEYVAGQTIGQYCDQRRLTTDQRLGLFEQVCHALQHAHYKGILHRDLKPSNILVVEIDGQPQVKIIDFGIAKAIHGADDSPFTTQAGQFVGTPAYASPEQAAGEHLDTRSDVFSMGVILYELLSGTLPWDCQSMTTAQLAEQIRTREPQRPSARLASSGAAATTIASQHGADVTSLTRRLRGDLDRIVMKAMHKDRSQRYGMAADLAEDIRRHLAHEPILARPPTLSYQARKFVRRNRVLVTATAMVLAAVLVGSVTSVVGFVRARQALAREAAARKDEQAQRQVAENVSEFLRDMLGSVDPRRAQGKPVLVREVLDRASAELPGKFQQQPLTAAALHAIIAETYHSLGLPQLASEHARSALDLRRQRLGDDHPETLEAGVTMATELIGLRRSNEAETMLRDVLERRRRISGPDDPATLVAEEKLAMVALELGRALEANSLQQHVLETRRRVFGEDHESTLRAMQNMAPIAEMQGRTEESMALLRASAEGKQRTLGPNHPMTLQALSNLATGLMRQRRFAEAEPIQHDVLERRKTVLGENHEQTLSSMSTLGSLLQQTGRLEEAEATFRDALTRSRQSLVENHPNTLIVMYNLGRLLAEQQRNDEAGELFAQLYESAQRAQLPPGTAARYASAYGFHLIAQRRYAAAEAPLTLARQQLEAADMAASTSMRKVLVSLASVYQNTNRSEDARLMRAQVARSRQASTIASSQPSS